MILFIWFTRVFRDKSGETREVIRTSFHTFDFTQYKKFFVKKYVWAE